MPSHLQLLLAGALLGGVIGLGLLITSPARRERARQQMLSAVAWRGDERVLDVGCGNGFLMVEVAKRLTTGTATGIDVWKAEAGEQSVEVALRNAHLEGVADRIEMRNADARRMPFADATFDVIVSSLMLHHAGSGADRNTMLAEMLRVLRPGGTILLYDALPLIAGASSFLRAHGMPDLARSRGLLPTLVATGARNGA